MRHVFKAMTFDRDIAVAAAKQTCIALQYVEDSLMIDRNVCSVAQQQALAATEHAFEHIKSDRDVHAASQPSVFLHLSANSLFPSLGTC